MKRGAEEDYSRRCTASTEEAAALDITADIIEAALLRC